MKCLDTYALVEIHDGNIKAAGLLNEEAVIADLTMAEFYGYLYKKHSAATADYWHKKLGFLCRPVSRDIMARAMRFRIDNRTMNLSFFDCVGYIFAIEKGAKFVTGDKAFRQMKGVEFMK